MNDNCQYEKCSTSNLFTFLENFDIENPIKIYDENGNLLFEGQTGDVPQKITNLASVIRGTAILRESYLEVKVKNNDGNSFLPSV